MTLGAPSKALYRLCRRGLVPRCGMKLLALLENEPRCPRSLHLAGASAGPVCSHTGLCACSWELSGPSRGPHPRWSVSVCSGCFSQNTTDIYVSQSGGWRSEMKAPAEALVGTAPPRRLQRAVFSLGPPLDSPLGPPWWTGRILLSCLSL